MDLPAQQAGSGGEEATQTIGERLPTIAGQRTILVDSLDGGRMDRLAKDGSSSRLLLSKGRSGSPQGRWCTDSWKVFNLAS